MSKTQRIKNKLDGIQPVVSEKSLNISQFSQYLFKVSPVLTKKTISKFISEKYSVTVESVNTLIRKPKKKIFKGKIGTRKTQKYAYVSLKKGQSIDIQGEN